LNYHRKRVEYVSILLFFFLYMAKLQSWEVSDALWEKVAPLVPKKKRDTSQNYIRKVG
jgi:hypothetical protein